MLPLLNTFNVRFPALENDEGVVFVWFAVYFLHACVQTKRYFKMSLPFWTPFPPPPPPPPLPPRPEYYGPPAPTYPRRYSESSRMRKHRRRQAELEVLDLIRRAATSYNNVLLSNFTDDSISELLDNIDGIFGNVQ
jgi:hypothetical protein